MKSSIEQYENEQYLYFNNLNYEQKKIVFSKDKAILVTACPGSGKTTVIINRLLYIIKFGIDCKIKFPKTSIIVITFTKAAAENMKKRFKEKNNEKGTPFFGTIHSFCYGIIKKIKGEVKVIEEKAVYKLIKEELLKYVDEVKEELIKDIRNKMSKYKMKKNNKDNSEESKEEIYIKCYRAYEDYKEKNNLLDFDDLIIVLLKLLKEDNMLLHSIKKTISYILVDEFQDCDSIQVELIALLAKDKYIFAVGDPDQSIYGFRGANTENIVHFNKIFKEAKLYKLTFNYRSGKEIVNLSSKLINHNKNRIDKEMYSKRDFKGEVFYFQCLNEGEEGEKVANILLNLKEKGISYEDIAVIYRTNLEAVAAVNSLIAKNIPFKFLDSSYDFFSHFLCEDLIAYLSLIINPYDKESFIRIVNKPYRYISKLNIDKLFKYKYKISPFVFFEREEATPIFQLKSLDRFKRELNKLNERDLKRAIDVILHKIGYLEYVKKYCKDCSYNIEDIMDILNKFIEISYDYDSIDEFVTYVKKAKEAVKNKKIDFKGVNLATIHGVKGMEFESVFILNCCEGNIPHSSNEEREEERRLFYVGMTRAIKELYVFSPKKFKGNIVEPSNFLVEAGIDSITTKSLLEIGDSISHRVYGVGIVSNIKDNTIKINFNSGKSKKFDLNNLIKNNLIKTL